MSEPFLAEIRIVAFQFAPRGWAFCDGQILPINQNQSLYSLLGTYYGGNGRTDFALPDLRGRTPIGYSDSHPLAQKSGEELHTLADAETPSHRHSLNGTDQAADTPQPGGNRLAQVPTSVGAIYTDSAATLDAALSPDAVAAAGGGQGHNNMQPYLALNFCIALQGLFPSRN